MRKIFTLALCFCALINKATAQPPADFYRIQQVKQNKVTLTDDFWLPKIRTIQEKTIAYAFDKCRSEGRLENFKTAGDVWRGKVRQGEVSARGAMPFDDTDVYKTIEGAAWSLINAPNPALNNYLDSIIGMIAYGQEPDGYLTTWRTINPKHPTANWVKTNGDRWNGLDMSHELYNSGHLFEAAAAHYWATGKRNFLDIALKNADLLVKVFGDTANYEIPGHQIVETGLIKLYQIAGKKDYLRLAKKFLDLRGDSRHRSIRGAYSQDHLPVTGQDEVVGHAVRAVYMYAGMTDIAALYGDKAYRNAVHKLWDNMTGNKMYITGGLGARHSGEAFGDNYELPNLTAYSETCAAIGGVYWAERMFRLTGEAQYVDILERMLYNGVIAGISLGGTEFFYPNPLEADGAYKFNQGYCTRASWFDCSCCPTNLIRFIPFIPNMIYAVHKDTVYVNLFMSNRAEIPVGNETVTIEQQAEYPRNGNIKIRVKTGHNSPLPFTLKIRIPSWVQNTPVPGGLYAYADQEQTQSSHTPNASDGYYTVTRTWTSGDSLALNFPMKVRTVKARPEVKDDAGKISVEYGPLVYCMEEIDNPATFDKPLHPQSFHIVRQLDLLGDVNVIRDGEFTLIPYYAWSNRGVGKMKVFFDNTSKEEQPAFTQWAKTPPMGWNSWDCYGPTVEEHEVKANADYMAEHLKPFGWEYIVVDIRWFVENDKAGGYNQTDPRYVMDEYGRYLPAVNRFPSAANNRGFKPLADYIHSKGLKFGIHIMRGVPKQAVEKKLPIKGTNRTADQIYSADLQCEWLRDNYTV
ncbi:MAG: glycoside hydrolase family 127 protein, partial [Dysgonamonadaceae bacterium]|nr:glycoside hydrolase family 127 protein [Dysgonamonadaceae bacterium]